MVEKTQENTSFVITENSKANSFECGRASLRHKIYYGEIEELKARLTALLELGLIDRADLPENLEENKLKEKSHSS